MITKTIKQKNVLKETGKKNINPRFKIHGILRREDTKKKEIPKSWQAVKGILKGKKIDPFKWQKEIRNEWKKRSEKLRKIYKSK